MRDVRECVVVERKPFGSSSFSLCHAEFEVDGTLIIRIIETGMEMHRFAAGTWAMARGVGAGGLDLYSITPAQLDELARRAS